MKLTVAMSTYRDFDGVYFTIQALRLYQDMTDVEILVIDNHGCEATRRFVERTGVARYILALEAVGTAAPRNIFFREAQGDAVLSLDSHVLLAPGALARLKLFYDEHPDCLDLLQGPLVEDGLVSLATHLDPVWRDGMWGVWAHSPPAGEELGDEPFDIPMQGVGLFSCRTRAWPGFHPGFRGWGGEEGYIHEKFRQLGRRCLCLPWLRWLHRFDRPAGVPYPLRLGDRITNYVAGHRELGLDEGVVLEHFRALATDAEIDQAVRRADEIQPGVGAPAYRRTPALISCLCPTFGRCGTPWQFLLEEAVESFLRQTDRHSELLILNDHPAQHLEFDHPRVRVFNQSERFPTLGEKYNALAAMAAGSLLTPWEDDDISLPHRLELSREHLGEEDYYNPRRYWFLNQQGIHWDHRMGVGHNLSIFRKRAWRTVGGYPLVTGSQDFEMHQRLAQHPEVRSRFEEVPITVPDWYYIYRWDTNPAHLSAAADPQSRYDALGQAPAPAGRFSLRPHWRQDYAAMVGAARESWRDIVGTPAGATRPGQGGCDTTFKRGAAYLSRIGQVEDWGCGTAYFRGYLPAGRYRGIDQDPAADADLIANLTEHTSAPDGILLRHVLEFDRGWRSILRNALASFRRRMVLVISTPFVRATTAHHRPDATSSRTCLQIHFARGDLVREFRGLSFRLEENVRTETRSGREHVFYLSKDGPA